MKRVSRPKNYLNLDLKEEMMTHAQLQYIGVSLYTHTCVYTHTQKRHNAQLTRLQRQVSEAKSRRRQWEKEADQLRMSITQLRQRIEE